MIHITKHTFHINIFLKSFYDLIYWVNIMLMKYHESYHDPESAETMKSPNVPKERQI